MCWILLYVGHEGAEGFQKMNGIDLVVSVLGGLIVEYGKKLLKGKRML
jgi:hypothetical protein